MNPRTSTGQPPQGVKTPYLRENASIDFDLFKKWLNQNYRPFTAYPRYLYSRKYVHCLLKRDLTDLRMLNDGIREHALKALSALSKFLGIHEDFRMLVKNYGLKWSGKNNDDLLIARFLKNVNASEIFQWIREAKTKIPELNEMLELMAVTGSRLIEAIESYNLIIKLGNEGKLDNYFNSEREILEHFRFRETFIRNSKKVFISFVPSELMKRIAKKEPLDYDRVQSLAEWHMKKLRFGDIRELHASLATKHLRQPEIDFLHGRISTSVFIANYFNANLIGDLKERTFSVINEILEQIN